MKERPREIHERVLQSQEAEQAGEREVEGSKRGAQRARHVRTPYWGQWQRVEVPVWGGLHEWVGAVGAHGQ